MQNKINDITSTPAAIAQWLPSPCPTDVTAWSSDGATKTTNLFRENTQNIAHVIYKILGSTTPMIAGGLWTAYFEVKPAGRTWVKVAFPRNQKGSWFELSGDGALGALLSTPYARGIQLLDDGYYGIWVSAIASSNQAANGPELYLALADEGGAYLGDGSSGVNMRLAQVCDGGAPIPLA